MAAAEPTEKKCSACESPSTQRLEPEAVQNYLAKHRLWSLSADGSRIQREIVAINFQAAFEFLTAVAAVAERHGHHPDISLYSYRNVRIEIYTHSVKGLTEFDFTLAVEIDELPIKYSPKFLKEQNERLALP